MKRATSILLLLLAFVTANGQNSGVEQSSGQIEIRFDLNSSSIDSEIADNQEKIEHLTQLIERLQNNPLTTITRVEVNSYASPDGGYHYNQKLSLKRSAALYDFLTTTAQVPDSLIVQSSTGIDWQGLYTLVESSEMEHRDKVLDILDNVPEETWRRVNPSDRWQTLVDSRTKHLMDLKNGNPYRYILANFYPQLRRGSVVVIHFKAATKPIMAEIVKIERHDKIETLEKLEPTPKPTPEPTPEPAEPEPRKPIRFALKSNLLYDVALIPNIELEVPIGKRWSVAGEWIFPWWITADNANALQILSGNIEGRYWFGNRDNRPQLTGWFAALYAGGGLYDLQLNSNGYQGEFFIAAGLAAGYAHTINKSGSLRMEYSLGMGYLETNYRYYEGQENNNFLVWQYDGQYSWLGPTKAKVSLVWFIDWQRGGKR